MSEIKDIKQELNKDNKTTSIKFGKPLITEEVNLDDSKSQPKEEKVSIDIMSEDFIKSEISKNIGKAEAPKSSEAKPTVEEIEKEIKQQSSSYNFSYDDLEMFSEIIIDILDTAITSALRWYAKDNSDAPYSITEKKRSRLVKMLTKLLVKYQARFSLEFLFIVGLVIAYVTPFNEARKHRKEVNNLQKALKAKEKQRQEDKDIIKKAEPIVVETSPKKPSSKKAKQKEDDFEKASDSIAAAIVGENKEEIKEVLINGSPEEGTVPYKEIVEDKVKQNKKKGFSLPKKNVGKPKLAENKKM